MTQQVYTYARAQVRTDLVQQSASRRTARSSGGQDPLRDPFDNTIPGTCLGAAEFKLGESMGVFMEKPMLTELLTNVDNPSH